MEAGREKVGRERERTLISVGREVRRIWKKLGEGKHDTKYIV